MLDDKLVEDVEAPQNIKLDTLTVKELRSIAKQKGIEGYSGMTKVELIEKLG